MSFLVRVLSSPKFGGVLVVAGVVWEAVSDGVGPELVGFAGFLQAFGGVYAENLGLRAANVPRLSLVFKPGENKLFDSLHINGTLRKIRVGVANSGESVTNVAVKLARIHPDVAGVFPMQELQQTHQNEEVCRFDVHRSDEPQVFVEVISQSIQVNSEPKGHASLMSIEFAKGRRNVPLTNDMYMIWLVIDGQAAGKSVKYLLKRNHQTGQYDMEEAFA